MSTEQTKPPSETIEVGATGDDLRLWIAVEARRQSERRLADQYANISSLEARATAILSWSATSSTALIAFGTQGRLEGAAWIAGAFLLLTSILCAMALYPREWSTSGYELSTLECWKLGSELEIAESTAMGLEDGIKKNDARIARFSELLRQAWITFAAAPAGGFLWAVVSSAGSYFHGH